MTEDIFVPKSTPEDALVGPLHTVTYVVSDKQPIETALVQGYGLSSSGWSAPAPAERARLASYLGFGADDELEFCCFFAPGAGANAQVRAIYTTGNAKPVRTSYDGLLVGGATVSFPKPDLYEHEKVMAAAGFSSTIGVKEMEFESPTGEVYISAETIFFGPENAYLLAVKRPDIFVPVGPMDAATGVGGAAYSARCVDNADAVVAFLSEVMGYEVRRDVTFPIGEESALLLPEGAEERFIQAFAPGSSSGYLVVMDHGKDNRAVESVGPPNRGIVMWSFATQDIDEVYRRARNHSAVEVVQAPTEMDVPGLDCRRVLQLKDPGGFPIEVFEV